MRDSDPFSLQQHEWSDCRNVRFDNRSVSKITGEQLLRAAGSDEIRALTYWEGPVTNRYVYTTDQGETFVVTETGNPGEITEGTGGTEVPLDTSGVYIQSLFNGGHTFIVCDGENQPKYVHSEAATLELDELPDWNYGSDYTSVVPKVIRPFRNVLVAGNLTYTASGGSITYGPGTIRISGLAAPGDVPTWDPAGSSPTTEDEITLSETSGIVDMIPFQNKLLIYTSDSIFSISLTGNTSIPVATSKQLEGRGMLSSNCGVEIQGQHFVVGPEDIYVYGGGNRVSSVADGRIRDYFYDNLNYAQVDLTHVIHNSNQSEVWICYPKGSSTTCNEALILNYLSGAWSIRDLPDVYSSTYGPAIESSEFTRRKYPIFGIDSNLLQGDVGTEFYNGQDIDAYVERKGFDVAPNAVNFSKWVDSIYILATGEGEIEVKVRTTDSPGRPVDL